MKNKVVKKRHIFISALITAIVVMFFCSIPSYGAEVDITVPFECFGGVLYQWDFPYSDDLFDEPSEVFSNDIAKASLGLMVSAFEEEPGVVESQHKTFLGGAGFQDIYECGV